MVQNAEKGRWYQPRLDTLQGAAAASDQGFHAAIIVAVLTAFAATLALLSGAPIATIDASAYIDAVVFAIIAWQIKRRSKFFAVTGLLLFIIEKAVQFSNWNAPVMSVVIAGILMFAFVNGVRGTFALSRLRKREASAGGA